MSKKCLFKFKISPGVSKVLWLHYKIPKKKKKKKKSKIISVKHWKNWHDLSGQDPNNTWTWTFWIRKQTKINYRIAFFSTFFSSYWFAFLSFHRGTNLSRNFTFNVGTKSFWNLNADLFNYFPGYQLAFFFLIRLAFLFGDWGTLLSKRKNK